MVVFWSEVRWWKNWKESVVACGGVAEEQGAVWRHPCILGGGGWTGENQGGDGWWVWGAMRGCGGVDLSANAFGDVRRIFEILDSWGMGRVGSG